MARYDSLIEWLNKRSDGSVIVNFSDLEEILNAPLPESARLYPAFWSTGNHVGRILFRQGWRASLRTNGTVEFHKDERLNLGQQKDKCDNEVHLSVPDLVLIGCVKEKKEGRHFAKNLYVSPLFRGRRARAEEAGCPWYILSAKYGLLRPDEHVESYDLELKQLSRAEREEWSHRVLAAIDKDFGSLSGKTIEIHAGAEYRAHGVANGLAARGAKVEVPLAHLSLFDQLSWYRKRFKGVIASPPQFPRAGVTSISPDIRDIVGKLTSSFSDGTWDFSKRSVKRQALWRGWEALPECEAVEEIRKHGASGEQVRIFLTLVSALDRARDADDLWGNAAQLYREVPWVFDPRRIAESRFIDLRDHLASSRVSQRHLPDTAAWRLIGEALVDERTPASIRQVIYAGVGDAKRLREDLAYLTPAGQTQFPFLSGPKVSTMWIRMMIAPGGATIMDAHLIDVAVDVQVRKVSEYLGVADTSDLSLDAARPRIQEAWREGAEAAVGPLGLQGTAAAIDPAVWFLGKWGCTVCERSGRRMPVTEVCVHCRYSTME